MRARLTQLDFHTRMYPVQSVQGPLARFVEGVDLVLVCNVYLDGGDMENAGFVSADDMERRINQAIEKAFEPPGTGQKTSPSVIAELGKRKIVL